MNLEEVIENVDNLSPSPQVLPKLQKLLHSENADIDDIGALIKMDASLTAEVIRLSNCVSYSGPNLCQSLEEAIGRVGYDQVYKVVCIAATMILLEGEVPFYKLNDGDLWEQSITCAAAMETIIIRQVSKEVACHNVGYTIGLLHGMGKVIINKYCLENEIDIYGIDETEPVSPKWENRFLGFDNGAAGAALMMKWNFPESFYIPVQYQFTPLEAPTQENFTCILHLSLWASNQIIKNADLATCKFDGDPAVLEKVGIDEEAFISCISGAKDRLQEIRDLFAIV